MTDRLVAFVMAVAVGILDRWLDARIARSGWPESTKKRAELLEEELVRLLGPLLGELARVLAKPLVGRALARAFPNDASTANWG